MSLCHCIRNRSSPPFFHPRRRRTVVWCYSPCNGCRRRRAERGDSSFFRGEAEQWWKQNHGIQRTKRKGPPHSQTIILQNFFVACEDLHSAERAQGDFFPLLPIYTSRSPLSRPIALKQRREGGRERKKRSIMYSRIFSLCVFLDHHASSSSSSSSCGRLNGEQRICPCNSPQKLATMNSSAKGSFFSQALSLSVARRRKKEETST